MKASLSALLLVLGLAACSGGGAESGPQQTNSAARSEASGSGFSESDLNALRPETEDSRQVLLRLKGSTANHPVRGR